MFEDEYRQMHQNRFLIEYFLKDTALLFPPTTTPLSGVDLIKRLPSGDIERTRRVKMPKFHLFSRFFFRLQSIRVFFLLRRMIFLLKSFVDEDLPLTKPETLFKVNDNSDWSE